MKSKRETWKFAQVDPTYPDKFLSDVFLPFSALATASPACLPQTQLT